MLKSIFVLFLLTLSTTTAASSKKIVTIGTLAYRGIDQAHQRWDKTVEYLQYQHPKFKFVLLPLSLDQIEDSVNNNELNFLLGNPGLYYTLRHKGLSPVSSLVNKRNNRGYDQFGAIIFTRSDRQDINSLNDLKGKRFGAVSPKAFGGFQMAWREFKSKKIDPFTDFKELKFIGIPMDKIVHLVEAGKLDAGTVRTDLLERMQEKGLIKMSDFKVINAQHFEDFPFQVSTRLYPDWIFSSTQNTSNKFSSMVRQSLLEIKADHPAAIAGHYIGWTHQNRMEELLSLSLEELVEVDATNEHFISIEQMMKELKIGPYKAFDE